jgi:uncharacterized protein YjbK
LSKADYVKLIRVLKPRRPKSQRLINYYFDDEELRLRKKKYALRIRIVDGNKVLFTLKYPAKQPKAAPSALKVRVEHEVEISLALAKRLLKHSKSINDMNLEPVRILKRNFSKETLDNVAPLGLIETRRTVVPVGRNGKRVELEIDRCKMFNKKFYELEVETNTPKRADRLVREFLESHDIPYLPLTRSKFGRFIEEWKRRR